MGDYVNKNYRVEWNNGKTCEDENRIEIDVIEEFWSGALDTCSLAKVFIDKTQINVHFFDEVEMESDIDPRQFNSIDDHDKLLKYMKGISILLDKEVILTPENERDFFLFMVINDKIVYHKTIDQDHKE